MKPLFITFEGIDRAGKTTQINILSEYLNKRKINHIITREPGGEPVAEKIRNILLHSEETIDPTAELLLYVAGRKQHIEHKIKPALKKNLWVLCDRFIDSTIVYQGVFRNINIDIIKKTHQLASIDIAPHITFYIDIPVEISEKRIMEANNRNRMERFSSEQAKKMRQMFIKLHHSEPKRIALIDGRLSIDEISSEIIKRFEH